MTKNLFFFSGLFIVFFATALLMQNAVSLHGDVGYLIYTSNLLLHGGTYGKDFFETNPPMILYLYIPVLWLAKFTALSMALSLRIYVFTLILYSSITSYYLLQKIIDNKFILNYFISAILFALLFLPANQFGQREHLFVMLVLPYVFSTVCLLEHKKLNFNLKVITSLLAGIGFCIKPYFIIAFIFTEIYIIYTQKKLSSWFRLELVIITSVILIYLISTYLLFPTYFKIMLPLIHQFYFEGIRESWIFIFTQPIVIFTLSSLVCFLVIKKHTHYYYLFSILTIFTAGTILSFIVTQTAWFYHTIPALIFAFLFFSLFIAEFIYPDAFKKLLFFILVFIFIFYIPINNTLGLYAEATHGRDRMVNDQLINYLSKQSGPKSVFCFSSNTTADCFPLVYKTPAIYATRFPFFWWMRGMMYAGVLNDFLINAVAEDLNQLKPRWVIINDYTAREIFGEKFDYIQLFSKNNNFSQAFKNYRYIINVDYYRIYERGDH